MAFELFLQPPPPGAGPDASEHRACIRPGDEWIFDVLQRSDRDCPVFERVARDLYRSPGIHVDDCARALRELEVLDQWLPRSGIDDARQASWPRLRDELRELFAHAVRTGRSVDTSSD